jgi:hypothetical protein
MMLGGLMQSGNFSSTAAGGKGLVNQENLHYPTGGGNLSTMLK